MRVGIFGNSNKIKAAEILEGIAVFLQENGYEVTLFSAYNEIDGVDALLVLGGDGAILHSAVYAAKKHIPIIGVNYGTLGFLTEYEKAEWTKVKTLLDGLRAGQCRMIRRSLLELSIADRTFYALNEVALQRDYGALATKSTQILRLGVRAKEGEDTIAGDGVLWCTPTGSTAYSLSAGGAILTPEVPVIMMTPICAFSMRARPIVFSDEDEFTVRVVKGKCIALTDGGVVATLPEGATVRIRKAPFTADFPTVENADFLARVRNKLNG